MSRLGSNSVEKATYRREASPMAHQTSICVPEPMLHLLVSLLSMAMMLNLRSSHDDSGLLQRLFTMRFLSRASGVADEVFGECMAATKLVVSRTFGFRHESTEGIDEEAIGKRDTDRYQPPAEASRHRRQDSISRRALDNPYSPKISATSTLINDTSYSTTVPKQPSLPLSVEEILALTKPTIEKLLQDSGSVGASIGVLRHGQQHFVNLGTQDLGVATLPDKDTVYLTSSMSKPIISTAVGILMDDFSKYQLKFDTPVSAVLSELKGSPGILKTYTNQELTVGDLLDLRSSFQWMTNLWESPNGDIPWKTIDPVTSLLQHLPANDTYTSQEGFVYNRNYSNECFALMAMIIERKTGHSWTEFVREKVFEPLGMHDTFVGLTEAEKNSKSQIFAKSHSVQVTGVMPELLQCTDAHGVVCRTKIAECFDRHYGHIPQPVEILPSQASGAGPVGPPPVAAAAGIMSTTSDLLKFYSKIMDVCNQRQQQQNSKLLSYQDHVSSPLERGINHLFSHIERKLSPNPFSSTCTYSGGWNTVTVPMTSEERNASPRPRWPGADGDNARRLESAINSKVHGDNLDYTFFVTKPELNVPDVNTEIDTPPVTEPEMNNKHLALYHGGNMVGATSFCWLLPDHETAVVVLCNTRGFLLDAANLSGMLLAECLFLAELGSDSHHDAGSVIKTVRRTCEDTKKMARAIQIDYLYNLARYEHTLASRFREVASPPDAGETELERFQGRYELTQDVFITITGEKRGLVLRLYGTGYGYLLRELHERVDNEELEKTMTFAQPMAELIPSGVGGTNRLKVEDFVVVFKRETMAGEWKGFEWNFARNKTTRKQGDTSPYFWRRMTEKGTWI
ncbi:beta-lactamase/transpeptidase-like protein [Neurospora hispaniola]|uniref:Beta-lactamase/transpeptidase-like protein n=1 Tax=Neurospora hispaniola TaxID=588809 RepID=A0AAJ0MR22_9PEZI|nr:beta-lactamase/transpeptidase-like protein [Neurospora hispaniola]